MTTRTSLAIQQEVLNEKIADLRAQDAKTLWRPAAAICLAVGIMSGVLSLAFAAMTYANERRNDKRRAIHGDWDKEVEPLTPLEDAMRASAQRYAEATGKPTPHMIFLHGSLNTQVQGGIHEVVFGVHGMAGNKATWFLLRNIHDTLSGNNQLPPLQRNAIEEKPATFNYLNDPDKLDAIDFLVAHEFEHVRRKDPWYDNFPAFTKAVVTSAWASAATTLGAGYLTLANAALRYYQIERPKPHANDIGGNINLAIFDMAEKLIGVNTPLLTTAIGWKGLLAYALGTAVAGASVLGAARLTDRANDATYNIELGTDVDVAKSIGIDKTITALFVYGGTQYALAKALWRGYRNETDSVKRARNAQSLIDMVGTANTVWKIRYKMESGEEWPKTRNSDGDRLIDILSLYKNAAQRPVHMMQVRTQPQPPIK